MKKKHPEHVNHERWLVSYADFITLLFAFFVVLFASGQSDKRKEVMLAHAMQSAFRFNGIFDPHSKTPPISDDPGPPDAATPAPLAMPIPRDLAQTNAAETEGRIREVIHNGVAQGKTAEGAITVRSSPDGLVVSLREAGFFASGSADVREDTVAAIASVAAVLPHGPMRIEGHTDDIPIHTSQFATNWELSTARAASITRLLLAQGAAAPTQISAAGYAEFRPIASNDSLEGRAQNRRVDIVLLSPPSPPPSAKAKKEPQTMPPELLDSKAPLMQTAKPPALPSLLSPPI